MIYLTNSKDFTTYTQPMTMKEYVACTSDNTGQLAEMKTQTQVHSGLGPRQRRLNTKTCDVTPEQDAMTRVTESESDLPGSLEDGAEPLQRQGHSTGQEETGYLSCLLL